MDIFHDHSYMGDLARNQKHVLGGDDVKSNGGVHDTRIADLEETLALAERRCDALRQQVSYMKMLYTNSNQPASRGDHAHSARENNDRSTQNGVSSFQNTNNIESSLGTSANAQMQNLPGITLTCDPKDAMQLIVNEMTQTINKAEGTIVVHSNEIEEFWVTSRDKKGSDRKKKDTKLKKTKDRNSSGTLKNSLQVKASKSATSDKTIRTRPSSHQPSNKSEKRISAPKSGKRTAQSNKHPSKVSSAKLSTDNLEKATTQSAELNSLAKSGARSISSFRSRTTSNMTYLLPTFSYRLKCVPKSYRMGFNFHNIPFVVGKSTNKSHNLGMRIQETLSLIKLTRKDVVASRSQSKKDLTVLLKQPSAENATSEPRYVQEPTQQNKQRSAMTAVGSNKHKNEQLRTVLMNIHDEFSRLIEEHETLEAALKKKFDPDIASRVQKLEIEIDAKEIEINAFMNLYNEVAELRKKTVPGSAHGRPCPDAVAIQTSAPNRPASAVTPSESSTNLKMARLLRKIDQFQNDLRNTAYL